MNVLKYRVSLDMFDTLSQITIKAKKGDSACQIQLTLTEHGKIYNISDGCYATFSGKKADGNFVYDNCTIVGNTIVYDFRESIDKDGICQVSACEGIVECEIALYNANSEQLTSPRFTLFIDGTVYNGEEIVSTPEANALKELINEANATIDEIETKLENGEFVGEKGIQGEKGDKGYTPIKGVDYFDGKDGASGVHVGTEKPTDGNANVWINPEGVTNEPLTVEVVKNDNGHTVTITDANNTNTFEVLNGKEGTQGIQGEKGDKGDKGDSGTQGEKGADGYTPQKDVDYWTAEDKAQIVKEVLDSVVIQQPEAHVIYGDVDSQNNITIYGSLPNGTYSLKFEYEDGTTTDVGNIVIGDNSITPITKDVPLTWIRDIKIDKTTGAETTDVNYNASDYVEVEEGYTYTFKQLLGGYGGVCICFYDADKNLLGWVETWTTDESVSKSLSHTIEMQNGTAYIRIRQYDGSDSPTESFYPQHYVLTATNVV